MSRQVVKLQSVYTPTVYQSSDVPVRARYIFNLAKCINNGLAIGKHHYSTWLGNRETGTPETYIHKTKILPSKNAAYVYVVCLVEGLSSSDVVLTVCGTDPVTVPFENERAGETPRHLHELIWEYPVVGGVELTLYLTAANSYVLKGITVFDAYQSIASDDMTGYVDPTQFSRGSVLTNTALVELISGQQTLVEDLRKDHVHNAALFAAESLWRGAIPADQRWYNVLDTAYNTWNANAPGYWIRAGAAWDSDSLLELTITVDAYVSVSETMALKAMASDGSEVQESDSVTVATSRSEHTITLYLPLPLDYHSDYKALVQLFARNTTPPAGR